MALLHNSKNKNNEKKKEGFLGTYLPKEISSYFSLYCLSRSTHKSVILRMLITNWVQDKKSNYSREDLIQRVAKRVSSVWKGKVRRLGFPAFRNKIKFELMKKNIPEEDICAILKIITDENTSNS